MIASARTRHLGVIGSPVAHSYSPEMQEAAFAATGLDLRYGAFVVEPGALGQAIRGAGALGFVGLNVTVPHKEHALVHCRPDEISRRIGAVNTLVFGEAGELPRGLNTDVDGFGALLDEAGIDARGARACVLGAGGAARAVVWVLRARGARVTVVSRSGRVVRFADESLAPIDHVDWPAAGDGAAQVRVLCRCELLVDTTPRGLDPGTRFDLAALPAEATVVDVAARETTPLVEEARARGLRAMAGSAMLLHQGAFAFEAFTSVRAPLEAMRSALSAAMGRDRGRTR